MSHWLIENTLVALALAGVVGVAGSCLRLGPAARHVLWLVVLIKLITPPLFAWSQVLPMPGLDLRALTPAPAAADVQADGGVVVPAAVRGAVTRTELAAQPRESAPQDPQPAPKHGGVVHAVGGRIVTVRWAPELARVPAVGAVLWAGTSMHALTLDAVEDGFAVGRTPAVAEDLAVGAPVYVGLPPGHDKSLRARIEHVTDPLATLRTLSGDTPLQAEDRCVLYVAGAWRGVGQVRLVEDGVVVLRLPPTHPDRPWRDGQVVRIVAPLPDAPAASADSVTLVADYSDNRVVELDGEGKVLWSMDEVYGVWDVERVGTDRLLLTEFSVSRVSEIDRAGNRLWFFDDLRNPYDADRLANGNTLICDTFASRVIEVEPYGDVVWSFSAPELRPFDADRLANGNTLIADSGGDRVLEVDAEGQVVWQVAGHPSIHDADRLPNGNTLVTLRTLNKVREIDRAGKTVWEVSDLASPSDADRLPNGNTIVAENTQVREFDPTGRQVWRREMTWAVEVNRYPASSASGR